MTRNDIVRIMRTQLRAIPAATFTERTVEAPEVEVVAEIGSARREASGRECPVCLLFENYNGLWHWRVVVQVGWHHIGKGEDRKSRPDCVGTPWAQLADEAAVQKAVDLAALWLPTEQTPSSV